MNCPVRNLWSDHPLWLLLVTKLVWNLKSDLKSSPHTECIADSGPQMPGTVDEELCCPVLIKRAGMDATIRKITASPLLHCSFHNWCYVSNLGINRSPREEILISGSQNMWDFHTCSLESFKCLPALQVFSFRDFFPLYLLIYQMLIVCSTSLKHQRHHKQICLDNSGWFQIKQATAN